jgi:hypothetical protein
MHMIDMLRREHKFSILLTGNWLSQIGDGVHEFIFIITVLNVTKSDVALAGTAYFFRHPVFSARTAWRGIVGSIAAPLTDVVRRLFSDGDHKRLKWTPVSRQR